MMDWKKMDEMMSDLHKMTGKLMNEVEDGNCIGLGQFWDGRLPLELVVETLHERVEKMHKFFLQEFGPE